MENFEEIDVSQAKEMIRLKGSSEEKVSFEFPDIDDYLTQVKVSGSESTSAMPDVV